MEAADFEDDTKSDLSLLREELGKSLAGDTLGLAASNRVLDTTSVCVIDREPAVVVNSLGGFQTPLSQSSTVCSFHFQRGKPELVKGAFLNAVADGNPKSADANHGEGETLKGRKVRKKFGRKYFSGEIISYDPGTRWYKIAYEDGDEEELWWWELEPLLAGNAPESVSKKRTRTPVSEGNRNVSSKRMRKEQAVAEPVNAQEVKSQSEALGTEAVSGEAELSAKRVKGSGKRGRKRKHPAQTSENKLSARGGEVPAGSASKRTLRPRTSADDGLGFHLLGRETRKTFDGRSYHGKVVDYDPDEKFYKICYEDGDVEELEWKELKPTLLFTETDEKNNDSCPALSDSTMLSTGDKVLDQPEAALREKTAARPEQQDELQRTYSGILHPALLLSRYSTTQDGENLEFYAWGEVVGFDNGKCPELRAVKLLPSASKIVHLAASQHHLAALTAAGQVWVWRNKHGHIQERCNQWEHIPDLDNKSIMLVDIAGPDLNRSLAGYAPSQEDQVPDPFYLAAISYGGKDYIFQGSQPQEPVHTCSLVEETQHLSLEELLKLNDAPVDNVGRIVQVSVGTVEALDEPPFVGYITDSDRVYIRSATKDFMEEVNHVTGFSGKPLKIQCGKAYHAIIMTDDGRAWTWGRGLSTTACSSNLGSLCQPAHVALVGRQVIDVGCCGENYIVLTEDGDVHQWTHGTPTGISLLKVSTEEDPLRRIALGNGLSAGVSSLKKVHTWRTVLSLADKVSSTPLGRDEKSEDTTITALGALSVLKVLSVPGSLIAVGQKKALARSGSGKMPS